MNNRIIFGQYYNADSFMHRLDPRVKLIGLLLFVISLFVINNIYVLSGFTLLLFIYLSISYPFSTTIVFFSFGYIFNN